MATLEGFKEHKLFEIYLSDGDREDFIDSFSYLGDNVAEIANRLLIVNKALSVYDLPLKNLLLKQMNKGEIAIVSYKTACDIIDNKDNAINFRGKENISGRNSYDQNNLGHFKFTHKEIQLFWSELTPYFGGNSAYAIIKRLSSDSQPETDFHTLEQQLMHLAKEHKICATTWIFAKRAIELPQSTEIFILIED